MNEHEMDYCECLLCQISDSIYENGPILTQNWDIEKIHDRQFIPVESMRSK